MKEEIKEKAEKIKNDLKEHHEENAYVRDVTRAMIKEQNEQLVNKAEKHREEIREDIKEKIDTAKEKLEKK